MKKIIALILSATLIYGTVLGFKKQSNPVAVTTLLPIKGNALPVVNRICREDVLEAQWNENIYIMSHVIEGEAGSEWLTDEEQLLVGNVVMNRIESPLFPNTIKEVVFQPGQYACTWDGNYDRQPDDRTIENAKRIINGERFCPKNILYQSNSPQGEVYKQIGETYFCYG